MSKLIFNWLNEEVGLSKHITSFEDDFRDGYLLGELLYRYNQQDNFGEFETKFTPDARIKNYCLLEPTIRRLGLDFNFQLAFHIMQGQHGVTRALLAELRPILERIQKNCEPPIAPEGQRGQIMRVMKPGNEKYDNSMSAAFEKSVRVHMDNPTEVILQNTVGAKFQAIGRASDQLAQEGSNYDAWNLANERQRKREVFEHRKKHEKEFQKAWDLLNVEQWRKNQATGKLRNDKIIQEKTDYEMRKTAHFAKMMSEAKVDTLDRISAFDKRLEKEVFREDETLQSTLGISLAKTVKGGEGTGLPELEYVNQKYLDTGLNLALKTMKEHHEEEVRRQVSHDRRRRKFVRSRENFHAYALQHTAQSEIVDQLKNESKIEKIENEAQSKVLKQAAVMLDNRVARSELEEKVRGVGCETDMQWSKEKARREETWVVASQIDALTTRSTTLSKSKSSAERCRNEEMVGELIDRLLDLTDWVVTTRHLGLYHHSVIEPALVEGEEPDPDAPVRVATASGLEEKEEKELEKALVPWHIWQDAKLTFTSGLDMAEALMEPYPTNVSEMVPHKHSEQPLGVDLGWLLSKPFQSYIAFAPPGSLEAEVARLAESMAAEAEAAAKAKTDVAAAPVEGEGEEKAAEADAEAPAQGGEEGEGAEAAAPTEPPVLLPVILGDQEVPTERKQAEMLATDDSSAFISRVAKGPEETVLEGLNFGAVPEGVEVPSENAPQDPAAEGYAEGHLVTPNWLYTTPSKYLLGEVLVAARCAAEPLPEYPQPKLDVSTVPVRLAIAGVSDAARQAMSGALKEAIPSLAVINLESLVHQAVTLASTVLSREGGEEGAREDTQTDEEKLAVQVSTFLSSGKVVPDFLYVRLLVAAIKASLPPVKPVLTPEEAYAKELIDNDKTEKALAREAAEKAAEEAEIATRHPGFVLEDFPTTRRQAVMLCEAISGIDYESNRPRPADKASRFAQAKPETYEPALYDPKKCGLNKILYLDGGNVKTLTEQRSRARTDLETGVIVSVGSTDADSTILQTLYTPLRPIHTSSLEYTVAHAEQDSLVQFGSKLGLLANYGISEWEGDFKTLEEAVAAAKEDIMSFYFPKPPAESEAAPEDGAAASAEGEGEAPAAKSEDGKALDVPAEASEEEKKEGGDEVATEGEVAISTHPALVDPVEVTVPREVALYLVNTWKAVEAKTTDRTRTFFGSLRDVRYEMLQRRRGVHDIVYRHLVARDSRQIMFEDFRDSFNEVKWECRIDPDYIHELNLRALELGKSIWELCDTRRDNCAALLKKFLLDGEVGLNVHLCQVEGAAVVQSEYEKFVVSVHVLQDYGKAVANYDSRMVQSNVLEECLEIVLPSLEAAAEAGAGGGKKADKKAPAKGGKGAADVAVPTREVFPQILLPIETMRTLPGPKMDEEEDPKAKGKKPPAKGKGGGGDEAADPLSVMIAAVLGALAEFTKEGGFTIQRAVFPNQEPLCIALETAVWHEAERLKHSIEMVKTTVAQQTQWLEDCEKNLETVMNQVISERHSKEYAQVDRLLDMIHEVVRTGEPIRGIWEMSPDSIIVHQNRLVIKAEDALPEPQVQIFSDVKLNDEQLQGLRDWVDFVKVRDYQSGEDVLLAQDVEALLGRATNGMGPASMVTHTSYDNLFIRDDMKELILCIKVKECSNLTNLDDTSAGSGVSDPFATIAFQGHKKKTKVIQNDLNPQFDTTFEFVWTLEPGPDDDEDFAVIKGNVYDMDMRKPPEEIGLMTLNISENGLKEKLLEAFKQPAGSDESVVKLDPIPLTDESGSGKTEGTITLEMTVKDLDTEAELIRQSRLLGPHLPQGWCKPAVFNQIKTLLAPVEPVPGKPAGYGENKGTVPVSAFLSKLDLDCSPLDEDLAHKASPFKGHV